MKKYTKVYFDYFDLTIADFVPCEVCGKKAVDIHHILARSEYKELENDIENLMAVCRECHIAFGDKVKHLQFLKGIHANKIKQSTKN